MASVSLFFFFLLSYHLVLHAAQDQKHTPECNPSYCEKLGLIIGFPFHANTTNPECSVWVVQGCEKKTTESLPTIQFVEGGKSYEVLGTWDTKNFSSGRCESVTNSTHLPSSPFISYGNGNGTFLKCKHNLNISGLGKFPNISCSDYNFYYGFPNTRFPYVPSGCSIPQLPVHPDPHDEHPNGTAFAEFDLQLHVPGDCLNCFLGGRGCQSNTSEVFYCDKAQQDQGKEEKPREEGIKKKVVIGAIAVAVALSTGIGVLMVMIWCFGKVLSLKQKSLTNQNLEAFFRNYGPLPIRRYSYPNIKKMTNFFKDKLGEGGYGGVYKGKLSDGSLVAVKILKESRGSGEEFINEVASIGRTSHVNIVTLMGFCFEGSKRALIYEFMPNGSLDKFIYKKNLVNDEQKLEWKALYNIAVEIARGLEYLHRGCNTRILHFDIKPHDILLDENFCPKISDFGLAKICSREESIISLLDARGTAGYIAPEIVCRNFGGVSHKSDVYSYGMMVLEMVGGRKNLDAEADRTSEIFFPHLIYNRLELDEELGLLGIMDEKDEENARKMIMVSLWCIQTNPSSRPSMSRVVDMLEGALDSLQIPPKPFLSSPSSRSPIDSSTNMEQWEYDSVLS